jgi:hypothetical protein
VDVQKSDNGPGNCERVQIDVQKRRNGHGSGEKVRADVQTTVNARGKLQILLISLIFVVPLLLATVMYSFGLWLPAGSTNHGALLEPIINLHDEVPASPLWSGDATQWLMIYANSEECADTCRDDLLRLRQTRLMLGNNMSRVGRIFLHGNTPADKVFLNNYHKGLTTITDNTLQQLLDGGLPQQLRSGGIYLVDPLGNLIMYFARDIDPGDMVDDIKHLLDLSRIG